MSSPVRACYIVSRVCVHLHSPQKSQWGKRRKKRVNLSPLYVPGRTLPYPSSAFFLFRSFDGMTMLFRQIRLSKACQAVGLVQIGGLTASMGGRPSPFHSSCTCKVKDGGAVASAQPSAEAKQALDGFNSLFTKSQTTSHYFQTIDSNQVHLTRLTLSSMVPLRVVNSGDGAASIGGEEEVYLTKGAIKRSGIPTKSRLIPSEHLMFFTPRVSNASLGKDGSDTSFNPPGGVFTRRMWAGGEMTFERDNHLQVGDEAWERTIVEEEATHKVIKSTGSEMIVVWVKKEIGNEKGLCLTDRRGWIFQPKLDSKDSSAVATSVQVDAVPVQGIDSTKASGDRTPPAPLDPSTSTRLIQDAASLFRYSALTFNAHAIHLSPPWARQVEGHPDIVVHGPLNLSLLLRKWGREVGGWSIDEEGQFFSSSSPPVVSGDDKKAATSPPQLHKVTYRAKKPLHAGIPYWIGLSSLDPNKVMAVKETDGQVAMEATITTW